MTEVTWKCGRQNGTESKGRGMTIQDLETFTNIYEAPILCNALFWHHGRMKQGRPFVLIIICTLPYRREGIFIGDVVTHFIQEVKRSWILFSLLNAKTPTCLSNPTALLQSALLPSKQLPTLTRATPRLLFSAVLGSSLSCLVSSMCCQNRTEFKRLGGQFHVYHMFQMHPDANPLTIQVLVLHSYVET